MMKLFLLWVLLLLPVGPAAAQEIKCHKQLHWNKFMEKL